MNVHQSVAVNQPLRRTQILPADTRASMVRFEGISKIYPAYRDKPSVQSLRDINFATPHEYRGDRPNRRLQVEPDAADQRGEQAGRAARCRCRDPGSMRGRHTCAAQNGKERRRRTRDGGPVRGPRAEPEAGAIIGVCSCYPSAAAAAIPLSSHLRSELNRQAVDACRRRRGPVRRPTCHIAIETSSQRSGAVSGDDL